MKPNSLEVLVKSFIRDVEALLAENTEHQNPTSKDKPIDVNSVRIKVAEKLRQGYIEKIKEVLQGYGVKFVEELRCSEFEEFIKKIETIGGNNYENK